MPLDIPEIIVRIPRATPADIKDNQQVVIAALRKMGEVRIRLNIDVYAPGSPEHPKSRYYTLCGTAPTIICQTPQAVEFALNKIRDLVIELNGWTQRKGNSNDVLDKEG